MKCVDNKECVDNMKCVDNLEWGELSEKHLSIRLNRLEPFIEFFRANKLCVKNRK